MKRPKLFPKSRPTFFDMSSKGRPQIGTQKGEWVKTIFVADEPFDHLHNRSRLLSKFQVPFFSTHFSWYSEVNWTGGCYSPRPRFADPTPLSKPIWGCFLVLVGFGFCLRGVSQKGLANIPQEVLFYSSSWWLFLLPLLLWVWDFVGCLRQTVP